MRLHYSAREHSRVGREKMYFSDSLSPPNMHGVRSRYRIPWEQTEQRAPG
jgi:DNA adenine methylase